MLGARRLFAGFGYALLVLGTVYLGAMLVGGFFVLETAVEAQEGGAVPGGTLGTEGDAEFWRSLRQGLVGNVSIPDKQAGLLIQSDGELWRAAHNGPVPVLGAWVMLAIIAACALFFLVRGRIRIEGGASGRTILRFKRVERFAHWLTAISFIVLALTGLNILYGRYVLRPLIGADAFSWITLVGKYAHNYIAFAFMLGLVMIFVLWVRQNLPNRYDVVWLAKGGGLFSKHSHPPAKKFNAGQKILFWVIILGGVSISLSGISLLFPFELPLFAKTFEAINLVGFDLPTALTPLQEVQLAQLWHAVVALLLTAAVIGHIYLGTLGMEGAFDAMGSGLVDEQWARAHHNQWVAELEAKGGARQE